MARMTKLTHSRLTELLDYDPASGHFVWAKAASNRIHVGDRAGVIHPPSGGRYISLDGEKFMAHRLAWFYVKREWPQNDVRPSDGNFDNCAIANLSDVSRVDVAHCREKTNSNTSGFLGVSPAPMGRWQASITWDYRQIALGSNFARAEDASAEYELARNLLKAARTEPEIVTAIAHLHLRRRQRAAWSNLLYANAPMVWKTIEEFARDVTEIPVRRYAIAPVNAALPIGPTNYKWASAGHAVSSSKDRVAYNRANREANRDHYRSRDFKKNYGIDFADYQRMLIAQKGVCAICEQPETKMEKGRIRLLSVDHNHTTGAVRGLLCGNCNMAIGFACDDTGTLRKAIAYLNRHDPGNVVKFEPKDPNRDWLLVATPGFKGAS